MIRFAIAATMLVATMAYSAPSSAYAICFEPKAPSLFMISKPRKPYCATIGDGCDQWEIDSYKNNVKRYFDQLRDYLTEVESFRKKAHEYAECMADLD